MLLSASGSGEFSMVSPSLVNFSVAVGTFMGAGLVQFSLAAWVQF
jgi:hypothetical protein